MAQAMINNFLFSIAERLGFDLYDYWDCSTVDDSRMPDNGFLMKFIGSRLFGVKSRFF
jgi:hypothetical protein